MTENIIERAELPRADENATVHTNRSVSEDVSGILADASG